MSELEELHDLIEAAAEDVCYSAEGYGPSSLAYAVAADAAKALLAAGYRKPRTITTAEEVEALPQGTKLYSPGTTHLWVLNDLSHPSGGTRIQGTGGGYTFIRDFIRQQAPLEILCEPTA